MRNLSKRLLRPGVKTGNVFLLCLFLFLFLQPCAIKAQVIHGKNFTMDDGLPSNTVRSIFKDSRCIMWIGTSAGLCRFDGKNFTIYNGRTFINYTTKNGLVCDEVRRVWWSRKFHCLIIGTNKGVSVFDNRKFYSCSAKQLGSPSGELIGISYLEQKNCIDIHIYGWSKVIHYYPSIHKFGERPASISDNINPAWAEAPSYPEMPGGLYSYNGKTVERMSEKFGITDPSVWTVFYDSVFHTLFVGTLRQGMFRIPSPVFEWFEPAYYGLRLPTWKTRTVRRLAREWCWCFQGR